MEMDLRAFLRVLRGEWLLLLTECRKYEQLLVFSLFDGDSLRLY